jgi:hypothetical protein
MNGLCLPVVSGPKPAVHMPDVNLSLLATQAIAEEFSVLSHTYSIGDKSGDLTDQSGIYSYMAECARRRERQLSTCRTDVAK